MAQVKKGAAMDTLSRIMAQMKDKPEPPKLPPAPEPLRVPQLLPIIDPSVRDRVSGDEFLRSQGKFEVETSFGIYRPDGRFVPGVSATQFSNLMKTLNGMTDKGVFILEETTDVVEIMEDEHVRRITIPGIADHVVWEKKFRYTKTAIENRNWGYRISRSEEKFASEAPAKFSPNLVRYRTRRSFLVKDQLSDIYGFQIDLTHVKEVHLKKETKSRPPKPASTSEKLQWWEEEVEGSPETVSTEDFSIVKYEVEIERHKAIASKQQIGLQALTNVIKLVLFSLQGVKEDRQLMSLPERSAATKFHNDLFARDIRDIESKRPKKISIQPFRLWKDYWNKPTNIRVDDLLSKFVDEYSVTLKLDGVRRFILLTSGGVYAAGPPDDLWKIGSPSMGYNNTLLDAEMYEENGTITYYVFDILFYKGVDIRGNRLAERLEKAKDAAQYISSSNLLYNAEIVPKTFITSGTFYERTAKAFEMYENSDKRLDGLIFQPANWYKNNHTRKWKPASQMTIDFRLKRVSADADEFALLVGVQRGEEVVFKGNTRHPYEGGLVVPDGMFEGSNIDGAIAELKWSSEESNFEIYRIREDRDKPNALSTAMDVWEDIHNPISQDSIKGNTLQAMRRYHNIAKEEMLKSEFEKGDVIMDWGSGRGGDLKKWENVGLSKVFVVEPNDMNLNELDRRLNEMVEKGYDRSRVEILSKEGPLGAETIGGQDTEDLIKGVGSTKLNGITAFFSLTYFGKDPEMYQAAMESIDRLLPVGGKFVGIVMDGDRVKDALEESKKKQKDATDEDVAVLSNPSFEIVQVSEYSDVVEEGPNEIEISINDPTSMVKSQQEWLFYFSILERELKERNFELKKTGFLTKDQYNVLPPDSKLFSSFNRYFVFEKSGDGAKKTTGKKPAGKKVAKVASPAKGFGSVAVDELVELPNEYEVDLYRIGVVSDKSSFIHAVIRAFYTEYFNMNETERIAYVKKTRRMMARVASRDMYDVLNNGELAVMYTNKAMSEMDEPDEEQASAIGFQEYLLDVIDPSTFIGQQNGLELLSTLLGINILVLGSDSKPVIHLYGRDPNSAREEASQFAKTIVLATKDGGQYSLVAKKNEDSVYTVFSTEEAFVQNVLNEAYPLLEGELEDFS